VKSSGYFSDFRNPDYLVAFNTAKNQNVTSYKHSDHNRKVKLYSLDCIYPGRRVNDLVLEKLLEILK